MADGKMSRWDNTCEVPKHLLPIGSEILLGRTVRQIRENDPAAEVIVTSHDPRYGNYGAVRYEPKNNVYEIDRRGRGADLPDQDGQHVLCGHLPFHRGGDRP